MNVQIYNCIIIFFDKQTISHNIGPIQVERR